MLTESRVTAGLLGAGAAAAAAAACLCWRRSPISRLTYPKSERAEVARALLLDLQSHLRQRLEEFAELAAPGKGSAEFQQVVWLRDGGRCGGGYRFTAPEDCPAFNRCSLNFSSVHYEHLPQKPLASATAVSCIIHPSHPRAPSMHMHVSWTERKDGTGYWRVMADLNPSIPCHADTERFKAALQTAAPEQYTAAAAQGDKYFLIPALQRTRGVAHFYLESHATADPEADRALALKVGRAAVDVYSSIICEAARGAPPPTDREKALQLEYHTLYFFQVLTLDRGTTSGLLVHSGNDAGIMGSLPARVDRHLLHQWRERLPEVQRKLLDALVAQLQGGRVCPIDLHTKLLLADAVRAFYKENPAALDLQASGYVLPPTVVNHTGAK